MYQLKLALYVLFLTIFLDTSAAQISNNTKGIRYAHNISLTTLSGDTLTLKDIQKNKPVYLKFWASWCQPCRKQMPHLQKTYEKYGNDISMIAVNIGINDSSAAIKATIDEFNLTIPTAMDKSGKLFQAFNAIGTPYNVLLDKEGNIVFKNHEASAELDNAIALLAKNGTSNLAEIPLVQNINRVSVLDTQNNKHTALFFTSTWCDWYLAESRPRMSQNCITAQKKINALSSKHPEISWIGLVSRLWTGDKELAEYKDKYSVKYPITVDASDAAAIKYNVKTFPTLILFDNKSETFRTSDFNNTQNITEALNLLKKSTMAMDKMQHK